MQSIQACGLSPRFGVGVGAPSSRAGWGNAFVASPGWMTHVVVPRAARGKAGVSGWSSLLVYPCLSDWTSLLSRSTVSRDGPTVVYLAEGANAYIVTRARASVS